MGSNAAHVTHLNNAGRSFRNCSRNRVKPLAKRLAGCYIYSTADATHERRKNGSAEMFKTGYTIQTPAGEGLIVKKLGQTSVQVLVENDTLTFKSSQCHPLPKKIEGAGWWLPAQPKALKIGDSVMLFDGSVTEVTGYWGEKPGVWYECASKPKHHQVYALRIFIPDCDAYVTYDPTVNFDSFSYKPVTEDAAWKTLWNTTWVANFQPTHFRAIANYVGSGYASLNSALRHGTPASDIKYCDRLDMALAMGKTDRNMLIWRAGSKSFDITMPIGSTFTDAAFGSHTIKKSMAESWGGGNKAIFEVRVPAGSKGAYVQYQSPHKTEYEFLLPRNCTYRIVKIEKPAYGRPLVTVDLISQG